MGASDIRAGGAFWEILVDDKSAAGIAAAEKEVQKYQKEVEKANKEIEKSFKEAGDKVQWLAKGIAAAGAALTAFSAAGLVGIGAAVREFADFGSEINDFVTRTGVSADWAQSLVAGAALGGASMGDLEAAIRKMQKTLGKSGKDSGLSTEQQFLAIAEDISKIEDPTKRAARAMEVFGKSGTKLLPMMEGGAAALNEQLQQMRANGLILSDEDIVMADELGDSWDVLKNTLAQSVRIIGAALAPDLIKLFGIITSGIGVVAKFIDNNRGLVKVAVGVLAAIGALGTILGIVGGGLFIVGSIIAAWPAIMAGATVAIGAISAAFAFLVSPVGLAIAAVAALVALLPLLAYVLDANFLNGAGLAALTEGFNQLWGIASTTIGGIVNALMSGNFGKAGLIAMAGLNAAWVTGLGWLRIGLQEFAAWMTTLLVDLFGAKFINMVLTGMKAVIEAINKAADAVGLGDLKIDTAGLNRVIDLSAQGEVALKADIEANRLQVRAEVEADRAKAVDALNGLTKPAEEQAKKTAAIAATGGAITPLAFNQLQAKTSGAFSAGAAARLSQSLPQFDEMAKKADAANELLEKIAANTENFGDGADD